MIQIPQSTARVVMLKLFTSGTTTAATGKTVAITISKNGGAFANPNAGATNATEVSNGWYKVTLDTTDTGTIGDLVVRGTASGCDDTERLFGVVSASTGGLTNLDAAVSSRMATFTLPTNFAALGINASGHVSRVTLADTATNLTNLPAITTDWITAAGVSAAAATKIANAVEAEIIDETDSEKVLTAITDKIASVNPSLSGLTLSAIAAAVRDVSNASPAASSLGAVLNAVNAKTTNLPASPAAVGDIPTTAAIADKILGRNAAGGADGGKTVAFYIQGGPPKVAFDVPGTGQFTVYGANGTTVLNVGTYTTDAVDPVVSMTPG